MVDKLPSGLSKRVQDFARDNPGLVEILELFNISNQQYLSAVQALTRPEIRVTNSTNEE